MDGIAENAGEAFYEVADFVADNRLFGAAVFYRYRYGTAGLGLNTHSGNRCLKDHFVADDALDIGVVFAARTEFCDFA